MRNALFFAFDGVDGAGKTTQIKKFRNWLEKLGLPVVVCREPGSTKLGERIRDLLLSDSEAAVGVRAEMLLYMSARAQLVDDVIRPALEANQVVVTDRFLLASVVYQGHAGGLPIADVYDVGTVATLGLRPSKTFVLDIDPLIADQRRDRAPDRMEQRGLDFQCRVREGFLIEAKKHPNEIVVIDASADPEAVHRAIQRAAEIDL